MIGWWLAAALAAPPDGVSLEDTERWEKGVDALLDGPAGCWEIVGRATWNYDFGAFYRSRGDAAFAGRLVDGVWKDFAVHPLGEVRREYRSQETRVFGRDVSFFPLMGQFERGRRRDREATEVTDAEGVDTAESDARNALRESLDELTDSVDYSWASWDEVRQAVVLHRVAPMERANRLETKIDALFPDGGPIPSRIDVMFPERFTTRTRPPAGVYDARVTLKGTSVDGVAFPKAEAYSLDIGVVGFRFSMAQTIRYTDIVACGGSGAERAP